MDEKKITFELKLVRTQNFLNEKVVIFSHMKLKTVDQLFKIENSNDITFKRIFNEDWFMYTKLKVVT